MANATITAPVQTQTGNFNVPITFTLPITGFDDMDVTITPVFGNGTTGITFDVTGAGNTYNATFQVPQNVEGSLRITISGMVTPQGSNTPEAVIAESPIVHYDTTANVSATFGTVTYRDGGIIAVPITFGEAVVAPSKTIFAVTSVSGDNLHGMQYRLVGQNKAFELIFEIPPDRQGRFQIAGNGDVFKVSSSIWDNVVVTEKTIAYDTRVPFIKDYDIPANYVQGETFDVVLQFNVPVTFVPPQDRFNSTDATFLDHFIFEGADLGTPNLYRKKDNNYPTLPIGTVSDTDRTPLPSDWGPPSTVIPSEIYLLRYPVVEDTARGIFNVTLKEHSVRGPTGSPTNPAQARSYIGDGKGNFWATAKETISAQETPNL